MNTLEFNHSIDGSSVYLKRQKVGIQSTVAFPADSPQIIQSTRVAIVPRSVVIDKQCHAVSRDSSPAHLAAAMSILEHLSKAFTGRA